MSSRTGKETFEVVVIGGGPAGMAAASTAAATSARVLLVDEGLGPGGQIWRPVVGGRRPRRARQQIARLDRSGADVMRSTSVVDLARDDSSFLITLDARGEARPVSARRIVLATGARELFLPFPGWTLPNVFGVGGIQALLKSGLPVRGKRVVLGGSGPLMLPVAASLAAAGASVSLVAEQASFANVRAYASSLWKKPATLLQAIALRSKFLGTSYSMGTWVSSVRGDGRVEEATVTDGRVSRTIPCDYVGVAYGLVPNVELALLAGCEVRNGAVVVGEDQQTSIDGIFAAGEPTGVGGVDLALVEGEIAGAAAAGTQVNSAVVRRRNVLARDAESMAKAFALRDEVRRLATPDTIVCRCEDVPSSAIRGEWSAKQAKLYTRAGMGPCQGRICGAALQCMYGWQHDSVRPPSQPVRLSLLLDSWADEPAPTTHGER